MRKQPLRLLLLLLFTCLASWSLAQQVNPGQLGSVHSTPIVANGGLVVGSGANAHHIKSIRHQGSLPVSAHGFGNGNYANGAKTASCGPDTVLYPLAKTSAFEILTIGQGVGVGQWYPAPQSLTISGLSFYAWLDSATNQSVNAVVSIYNAGADSLPTGTALATTTVSVDSSFGNGSLAVLLKHATFTTPVTVTGNYVVTVNNPSGIDMGVLANDYTALPADGAGEFLSCIEVQTGWISSRNIALGGIPFDADFMLFPHVSYQLTASYAPSPAFGCVGVPITVLNQSSPIVESRFYNFNAFNGTTNDSYTWNYGDGSPEDNVFNANHTYATIGSFNLTLRDTIEGWTTTCADSITSSITVTSVANVVPPL